MIPRLERGEAIRRAYLGLSTAEATAARSCARPPPAARPREAGVRAGDVIVAVGGKRIADPDDVAAAIQDRRPGDSVEVELRRGGDARTVDVELTARPEQAP